MKTGAENYLIDTQIAMSLMNRDEISLRARVRQEDVSICVITLGELLNGAHHSSHASENIQKVQEMFGHYKLIRCTKITAEYYDHVKERLYRTRKRLPGKNIWIAATAIQHNLILVTRDQGFDSIEGLRHENW